MLNRTNLTLSALSNRLNLGTRSLDLNTSVNNGTALRIRHPHHDVMRETMVVFEVGDPFVAAYSEPPKTDPAIEDAAQSACAPISSVDACLRPFEAWPTWRLRWASALGNGRTPSLRSRGQAAKAASATSPRPGRGFGRTIGKTGAAGAAHRRTANPVAAATIAGS